ncbi:MAG: rhomboid family intramembrane serine protease [Deltaproteobacteria bacterium]|nr:rhomboid family intramembrane serine protease [Deltaproteobacteria bacterium]
MNIKPVIDHDIWKSESFLNSHLPDNFLLSVFIYALIAWAVTVLDMMVPSLSRIMRANGHNVFEQGRYINLVWGVFAHGSISHYLSNMMYIVIFGSLISGYFGHRIFWFMLFPAALITHGISLYSYSPNTTLIGSSGFVFIIMPYWIILHYLSTKHNDGLRRGLKTAGFAIMMLYPMSFKPTTSYRTHYIGMIAGIILGLISGQVLKNDIRRRNIEYCSEKTVIRDTGLFHNS